MSTTQKFILFKVSMWLSCLGVQFADKVNLLHQAALAGNDTALRGLLNEVGADSRLLDGEVTALYRAASKGHKSAMHVLLLNGADVDAEVTARSMDLDGSPYDLLRYAVRLGDVAAVENLLEAGSNVSSRSPKTLYTPLHDAVEKSRVNVIGLLIEHGADVNADSADGTPLSLAARKGSMDLINLLLKYQADINGSGAKISPVAQAIAAKKGLVAIKLLEMGADPYKSSGDSGNPLIHVAVKYGLNDVTKYLVKRGLVNQKDEDGRTSLYFAQNRETASILLDGGADLDAVTSKGETPLHHAAYVGIYEVVELLVAKGAKLDLLSNETYTIMDSLYEGCSFKRISMKTRQNLKIRVKTGFTPLAISILSKNSRISSFLIENTSDLNVEYAEWPILHIAAYLGDAGITRELLDAGADVDVRDSAGWTALHEATLRGKADVANVLINFGASVNASDRYGVTPLHLAAKYRRLAIAELLFNSDVNVTVEDGGGFTALTWAVVGARPHFLDVMMDEAAYMRSTDRYNYLDKLTNEGIDTILQLTESYNHPMYTYEKESLRKFLESSVPDIGLDAEYIANEIRGYADLKNGLVTLNGFRTFIGSKIQQYKDEHMEMVTIIVENMDNLDKEDSLMGWSPLHWAAATGDFDVVKLLTEKGANLNQKSIFRKTPMFLARYWGHREIYHYLKEAGAVW